MDTDLEDYWTEYRIIQEAKLLDDYLQEELNGHQGEGNEHISTFLWVLLKI